MPFKKKKKDPPAITTASLPDIVFMLLCFFMVVTKMRDAEVMVRTLVPQATELQKFLRIVFSITSPITGTINAVDNIAD